MAPSLLRCFIGLLTLHLVAACSSTPDGEGRYRVQSIGQAQRSVMAEVISQREAFIAAGNTGAGGAMGGAGGGAIALDHSDNAGVIVAGIIGGILVGSAIEGEGRIFEATEYVIRNETGALFTVAQINEGNEVFAVGDKVILVYGYPSRLIPSP